MRADIVIIGGGMLGSSAACHLARTAGAGDVVVSERGPTREDAATSRSNGGIRRLFSLPETIEMARCGLAFCRGFADTMAAGGEGADIGSRCQGHLFISHADGAAQMERNISLQERMGVEVELHCPSALATRPPSISTRGVDLSALSDHDARIDPHAALTGFRREARALGVRWVAGEAFRLDADSPPGREFGSLVADRRRRAACA